MTRFCRVICQNLIFIALFKLFQTAYAKEFAVKYAINNSVTDDELELAELNGILRSPDNSARKFVLIQRNTGTIKYTLYSVMTTIVYMYGNTMLLVQQLGGPASSYMFHFKFANDDNSREFQQLMNPISFQSGEIEAELAQLRLVDETRRTRDRKLSIQSATVLSTFVNRHEMRIFMIIEGSPGQYRHPQRTYFIFPENGFYITEPRGKEVMLFPSIGQSWKYILRFERAQEAIIFVTTMSSYSENRNSIPFDSHPSWSGTRYFKP